MKISNFKVTLLPHTPFLMEDGRFNLDKAMQYQSCIGKICYGDGMKSPLTAKQDIFDHVNISMSLNNVPKFLNMILANEQQGIIHAKSLDFKIMKDDKAIPQELFDYYYKWMGTFYAVAKEKYGDEKIDKLVMENSSYLLPITSGIDTIYTVPLGKLNQIAAGLINYRDSGISGKKDDLHNQILPYINKFLRELYHFNLINEDLLANYASNKLKILGKNLKDTIDEFGESYATKYMGSFMEYATNLENVQESYQLERTDNKEYFVPAIIEHNDKLKDKWLKDIDMIANKYGFIPQAEKVMISEKGTFDQFLTKTKKIIDEKTIGEYLAQTMETLDDYYEFLNPLSIRDKYALLANELKTSKAKILNKSGKVI